MKKISKVFGAIVAIVIIPGVLTAFIVFYIAKFFGFKLDFEKLKEKIWKKK